MSPAMCDSNGSYYQRATSRFASGITVCRRLDLDGRVRKVCMIRQYNGNLDSENQGWNPKV